MTLAESDLLERFDGIRVWQRSGQRAVHKPLLVMLALGRLWRGEPAAAQFTTIVDDLRKLLEQFGPSSAAASRHYPFWHLRTDGLWTLDGPARILDRPPAATPNLTELREGQVAGGFSPEVVETLRRDPALIPRIARRIVEAHFPESLQQDVLDAVGLEAGEAGMARAPERARRDPSPLLPSLARSAGEGWGGGRTRWSSDSETRISSGSRHADAHLPRRRPDPPQSAASLPRPEFLAWHKEQVFKPPPRE